MDEASGLGIALATDGNGRYCRLDPYLGTQLVLSEAYRNVAATGARPLAVTNCLNFGSPEDPAVMWQFAEAVRGLADGCAALGRAGHRRQRQLLQPDRDLGRPSHPGRRGPRRPRRCAAAALDRVPAPGAVSSCCSAGPRPSSADRPGRTSGTGTWRPAAGTDLAAEQRLAGLLVAAAAGGLLSAAHDLSDGGLAVALAESCLRGRSGCRVRLPGDPFTWLFSESAGRAIVAVRPGAEAQFAELRAAHGVPGQAIGRAGGDELAVEDCFAIPLAELAAVHTATLPALFG